MQFVIGLLTLEPGKREEFMSLAMTREATPQKEEAASSMSGIEAPSKRTCWFLSRAEKPASTTRHIKMRRTIRLSFREVGRYAVSGRFEEIEAARIVTQRPEFGASAGQLP